MLESTKTRLTAAVPTLAEYAALRERIAVLRCIAKNDRFPTETDVAREIATLASESAASKTADLLTLSMDQKAAIALIQSLGLKMPFIPAKQ